MKVSFSKLQIAFFCCAISVLSSVGALAGIAIAEREVSTIFIDRNYYPGTGKSWHINQIPETVAFPSLNSFRGVTKDSKKADFTLVFSREFRDDTSSYTNSVIAKAEIIEKSTGIARVQVSYQTPDITWSGYNNRSEYLKIAQALDERLQVQLAGVNSQLLGRELLYGGHLEENDHFPFGSNVFKYSHGEKSIYVQTTDSKLAEKLSKLISDNEQKKPKVFIGFKPAGSSDPSVIKFVVLLDNNKEVLFPASL